MGSSGKATGGSDVSARVYPSAAISIANATVTWLTFDSESFDTDTIHDLVTNTGRLTCKTAGKYLIIAHARFATHATGSRLVRIRLNGVTNVASSFLQTVSGQDWQAACSTIWNLAVNDYVEMGVWQDSGVALNISAGEGETHFQMVRLPG